MAGVIVAAPKRTTRAGWRRMLMRCRFAAFSALLVGGQALGAEPSLEQSLERGMDASAQLRALSEWQGGVSDPLVRPAGTGSSQSALERLRASIETGASENSLRRRIESLLGDILLVEAALDHQLDLLDRIEGGASARRRVETLKAETQARIGPLRVELEQVRRAIIDGRSPGLSDLRTLLDEQTRPRTARILGVATPHHRPRFPQRAPRVESATVPSYANAESVVLPEDSLPADGSSFPEAILAKAEELDHDYARIFDFVRSEIRTEWYAGQKRGPAQTLGLRAGNDVDQAALLIALLRASGAPARFVHGTIRLDLERLSGLLGEEQAPAISRALTRAGIANEPVVSGGQVAAFRFEHTWVSVHVPYANYRGSVLDMSGSAWMALAPAIKSHEWSDHGPGLTALVPEGEDFEQRYLDTRAVEESLPLPAEALLQRAETQDPTLDPLAVTGRPYVSAPAHGILPASLPFAVEAVFDESPMLSDSYRQQVEFRMLDEDGAVVLEGSLPAAGLVERRVTLSYQPAGSDDHDLILANGGYALTPPSLLEVRPVVHVDGMPMLVGEGALPMAVHHPLEVTVSGPGGAIDYRQQVLSGSLSALYFGEGFDGGLEYTLPLGESEPASARYLGGLLRRYAREWTRGEDLLAALVDVRAHYPLPGLVMANLEMASEDILGLSLGLDLKGVTLDAGLRPVEAFGSDESVESAWYRLAGLHGSILEHRVFEEQWAVYSVSADRLLALADQSGIEVLQPAGPEDLPVLAPDISAAIEQRMDQGYEVLIPAEALTVNQWTGTAWVLRHPDSGESGFFISGHYAGGGTTESPQDWVLDFLSDALRFPYDEPPNDNPLSAARVRKVPSSDNQVVTAGETTDRPLSVLVTDRFGRPVRGAQVEFYLYSGNGEFPEVSDQSVIVQSDSLGVASVKYRATEEIQQGWLALLNPEDEHATRVGHDRVGVNVAAGGGVVPLQSPFKTIVVPGPPASIERMWYAPEGSPMQTYYRMPHQGSVVYLVRDQYGNPVANTPVTLSAEDAIDCPHPSQTRPTRFSELGECSPQTLGTLATIGDCGLPALEVTTDTQGFAIADMMLTTATYAAITIEASVGALIDEYGIESPYGTAAPPVRCDNPDAVDIGYGRFSMEARTAGGWPVEAARPNELLGRPRTLVMGCTFRTTAIWWHASPEAFQCEALAQNLEAMVIATNDGVAHGLVNIAPMVYQFDVEAGPQPGWHRLWLELDSNVYGDTVAAALSGGLGSYFTVDGGVVVHNDLPVELNDEGRLTEPVLTTLEVEPLNYRPNQASTWLQRAGEDRQWNSQYVRQPREGMLTGQVSEVPPDREYTLATQFDAGLRLNPHGEYEAAAVLNPGTPWEIDLTPTSLSHGQRIISGFDAHAISESTVLPEVLDSRPKHMHLVHDMDVANQLSCPQGGLMRIQANHAANVSLTFYHLNNLGEPTTVAWQAMESDLVPAGMHTLEVPIDRLRFGDFYYELEAESTVYEGLVETYAGTLSHKPRRRDTLSLAHAMLEDVNLFDGSLNLSRADVLIDGRGPGLRFVRSYSSHRGNTDGDLGFGWTHNYAANLQITACGEHILTGADGNSVRFVPDGFEGEVEVFRPLRGYNGTLKHLPNGSFEFFAVNGTRYVLRPDPVGGHFLDLIEDSNGNRVHFEYNIDDGHRLLHRVSDDAGRALLFTYENKHFEIIERRDMTRPVLVAIDGPEGLRIDYEYDGRGNLVRVQRQVADAPGRTEEGYEYESFDDAVDWPGDRPPGMYFFGDRLTVVRDEINGAERGIDYEFGLDFQQVEPEVYSMPVQRVVNSTAPDNGRIDFSYGGARGLEPVETVITNARNFTTTYQLNLYGAATEIEGPIGTERFGWDMDILRQAWSKDANGTRTDFGYDEYGNRTSETITSAHGSLDRTWSFHPPEGFDVPIKNRVAEATDYRGIPTTSDYDERGNLTSRTRGGITETFGYNARGDRVSSTDGTGYTRNVGYDGRGYPVHVSDLLGVIEEREWDDLGRIIERTDGEGFTTTFTYDNRDRRIRVDHPNDDFETIAYDDAANTRVETNARGIATTYLHDDMGRLLQVSDALGIIESFEYDYHGNVIFQTDGEGNSRTHSYDGEDRRIGTQGPEGLVIEYQHDRVGNVILERVGSGDDARTTTYKYEHPRYERTEVRRVNPAGEDAVDLYEFDGNGNQTLHTNPRGRNTTRVFDDRNRLVAENAPEGRVQTSVYDDADRLIQRTLNTEPTRILKWTYDDRGREISHTDAAGAAWIKSYDGRDLVIEETDPRGATVAYEFDERGRLELEVGPEPDMVTEYVRDGQGNVVSELWANGRLIESDYDIRDRLVLRSDQLGLVEAFDYDGNDNVIWEEDGEGRRTEHDYDDLGRRTVSRLPESRETSRAYNVHGDVTSETNARNHTTEHDYDALGRRVLTTLPDDSEISYGYDPAGNLTSETNARGFTTTYEYDGLNRRTLQTDPTEVGTTQTWQYDAAGNVLVHTDRRGIATRTIYDGEDRPLEVRRDGLLIEKNEYDGSGNVLRRWDANGRRTDFAYDLAGRRILQTRPGDVTTAWTYTALGDEATVTDPDGLVTTSTWDLRRRLDTRTNPAEETTSYEYDLAGNRTERKRPSGDTWIYEYDDADRLIAVTNPETERTTYGWDANGNLTSQTDALERTTSFEYDALDHRSLRTYHGGPSESFVHDARGNLITHTDANGQTRTFEYDGLDRRIEANYPAANGDESIQVEYAYDGNGNRTEVLETIVSGGTEISTYQYDAFDRLEVETDRFGQQITHVYDAKGNRIRRIDAAGTTIYGIDALDRVQSVTAPGRGAVTYTYSPAGRVEQIDHPDGTRTEQTYDEAGRLETIAHFRSGLREAYYAYDYDLNGNRSSQTEDLGSGEVLTTYDYDRADRLIETERDGRITTYVLDAVGNRAEEIVTEGGLTTTRTFDYNARDQLERVWLDGALEAEYAYDANGNRISATTDGVTREFNFGARDRLLSLNVQGSPPEVEWTYDDAGFRIAETTPAEARRFRWDGETMAFETNVLGNLLMRYDHGPDRLLAEAESGNTRTWLTDALKTPVKRLTETGTTYSVTRYDEYGEVEEESSPDIPRFGFTGHQRGPSEAPDLYYAQQRWYNSATGRFISEDPIWGEPKRPLSLHRYLYAYANPTVFVDPDGRAVVLSQIRDFFGRRRDDAMRGAEQLGSSDLAHSGLAGGVVARTGSVLGSIGGGIFDLAESGVGLLNTGANLVGSATGLISDKSISELDETFQAVDSTAAGAMRLAGEVRRDPVGVGSRTVRGLGAFGYAVFIEGDAKAQTQFGSALPSMFGAKAGFDLTRRSLRSADAGVRSGIDRAVEWAGQPTPARTSFVTEGADGATQRRAVSPDELLMRAQAAAGDSAATRELIRQGMVDGFDLVENSHAIRGEGGRFVSLGRAQSAASTPRGGDAVALESRPADRIQMQRIREVQEGVRKLNERTGLVDWIGDKIQKAVQAFDAWVDG
ncbi:RHS repeat-associated core domain-containing protein [Wenzhouxiangella sediminis]|uniref:Uncharacterized protein n=1 Tax=Wenzhouxiangella sediminis TaxID=1792836 RepID=A0A3E1KCL3_9GAMM|nr:RHS repeat-associated core domain-containing protein [Wenzhouxiangella sediminis]RFF32618.1 hypothetical protein DZC52_01370 [Wenzhouxiangella sediminis]